MIVGCHSDRPDRLEEEKEAEQGREEGRSHPKKATNHSGSPPSTDATPHNSKVAEVISEPGCRGGRDGPHD